MMPDRETPSKTAPVVTCPHCGKEHQWDTGNRFRPFCSERCKLIDLGKWASDAYRLETEEKKSEAQEIESNGRK